LKTSCNKHSDGLNIHQVKSVLIYPTSPAESSDKIKKGYRFFDLFISEHITITYCGSLVNITLL